MKRGIWLKVYLEFWGLLGVLQIGPAPITDQEANKILNSVEEGVNKPRPKVLFEPGEVVRII